MVSNMGLIVVMCLAMFVGAAIGGYAHQEHGHQQAHYQQDYYATPHYKYQYGVSDHHTGDNKHASESRDGDKVSGQYSLQEPDGGWRTVTYTSDKHSGFKAHVSRTPGKHGHGWGQGGQGGQGGLGNSY